MPPNTPTLSYFTRLSPSVYYLPRSKAVVTSSSTSSVSSSSSASSSSSPSPTPSPSTIPPPAPAAVPALATPASPSPRLVVLATWMGAQPPHMDKYIEPYRRLFPSSPILVLRSEAGDWLNPWKKPSMDAAATVVQSLYDASELAPASASVPHSPTDPDLVIHVWSNGGSASLARLRQSLAKQRAALPPYTLVLDSTPGQFSYRGTYSAFSLVAPKKWAWLLRPLLHGFVAWFWLLTYVRARLDFRRRAEVGEAQAKGKSKLFGPLALLAASHNTAAVRAREARRTYIYSREDALIPYTDVEEHGADARAKGFDVRMEEFKGTAHVAHARTEPERYWEIVRETWEGRPYVRDAAAEEEVKAEAAAAEGKEEEVTAVEQHVTA